MKITLLYLLLSFASSLAAKGRVYRQYAGGFSAENLNSEYQNSAGAYLESEFDYAGGYLSKAQSISYYEASSLSDGAIDDPDAASSWMSDIVLSSFTKLRVPSSNSFISIYGSLGLDLHLGYRQLTNEEDQFKTNWAAGWNYGGGVELRIKRLCIDARANFRRVFGNEFSFMNTNEIMVGLGWMTNF